MERKVLIWSGSSSNLAGAMLMVRTLFVCVVCVDEGCSVVVLM
jgi:hypothetical protein